jgi:aspartate kinase
MKPLIICKFGGTSVADPEKIQRAAERVKRLKSRGARVVVVVSAPGKMTDELEALAQQLGARTSPRELDVLLSTGELVGTSLFAMACRKLGTDAISLTGAQAGIKTGGAHTASAITHIRPTRIHKELRAGRIVVVAGFQGADAGGDTATLGRGGSDLTAVALAAVLKAQHCEIYTDVKGVYTADPRIVPQAKKLSRISYREMLELSSAGANVMLTRSIEVAQRYRVKIHVRSAFHPAVGTWIQSLPEKKMEKANVSSLALDKSAVRLSLAEVPDRPGIAARILAELSDNGVPADMVIQSAPTLRGRNDISFMTPRGNAAAARKTLERLAKKMGAGPVGVHDQVVKLTAVGTGFRRQPKVAAQMFAALAKSRINLQMIATSDLKIACVIDRRHGETALRVLHKAFGLSRTRR